MNISRPKTKHTKIYKVRNIHITRRFQTKNSIKLGLSFVL